MNLVQGPIIPQGAGRGLPSLRSNVGKWCKRDLDWLEPRGPTAGEKEKHTSCKQCLCEEFCFFFFFFRGWEGRERKSVEQPRGKRKRYRDAERQTQRDRETEKRYRGAESYTERQAWRDTKRGRDRRQATEPLLLKGV